MQTAAVIDEDTGAGIEGPEAARPVEEVVEFPIPRDAYAKMVDQLAKGGAKVIAFDANFPVPEKNSAVETLQELRERG